MSIGIFLLLLFALRAESIALNVVNNSRIIGDVYRTLFNGTEGACVCQMMQSNGAICALNYFSANQTCQLFHSNLTLFTVEVMVGSMLICTKQSPIIAKLTSTKPPAVIRWSFDWHLNDTFGVYNGVSVDGTVQWMSPGYRGDGAAAYFANKSYALVPYSLDLTGTSFTVSTWIQLLTNAPLSDSEFGVLTHCESMNTLKCFYLAVRYGKLFFSMYPNNLTGNSSIGSNVYYHVAYVYDRATSTQRVYLDGRLDGMLSSAGSYQGNASQMWIGASPYTSTLLNPSAYVDELIFVSRVKNASELLDEATLVAHYRFDNSFLDSSPNKIQTSTGTNTQFDMNGRVNQALLFNSSSSLFEVTSFYFLGQTNHPYSFSFWIYPFATSGMLILVRSVTSGWWLPMVGFGSSNYLVTQSWDNAFYNVFWAPTNMLLNTWTHIVATFSTANGLRLFVNGTMTNVTDPHRAHIGSQSWNTMSIGSCTPAGRCANTGNSIAAAQFWGKIDELRIYSRELTYVEVQTIAYLQ